MATFGFISMLLSDRKNDPLFIGKNMNISGREGSWGKLHQTQMIKKRYQENHVKAEK